MLSYYDNTQEMHSTLRAKNLSFITQSSQEPVNRQPLSELERVELYFPCSLASLY